MIDGTDNLYKVQDERSDGTDARTARKIETVEMLLDGCEICTNDGRERSTTTISTAVLLPETARTTEQLG